MHNIDLRKEAKKLNIYLWQIAEHFDICEMTLSRKLRHELSAEEKQQILEAIKKIKESRDNNENADNKASH